MPQKKKRSGPGAAQTSPAPVKAAPVLISTRSGRKIKPKYEQLEPILKPAPKPAVAAKVAKPPPKKIKPAVKVKPKKVPVKKKPVKKVAVVIEVSSDEEENNEVIEQIETVETAASDYVEDTTDAIDPLALNDEPDMPENIQEMDVAESSTTETDACLISQQLENLNVQEEVQENDVLEETSQDAAPEEEIMFAETSITEVADSVADQVVEYIQYEEVTGEFITEEFVPMVENTEVIIDDESQVTTASIEKSDTEDIAATLENKLDLSFDNSQQNNDVNYGNEVEIGLQMIHEGLSREEIEMKSDFRETQISSVPTEPEDIHVPFETTTPEVATPADKISELVEDVKSDSKTDKPKSRRPAKKEPKPRKSQPRKKSKPKPPIKKESDPDKLEEVRRSSRIKSISVLKQRSKGHGLVKTPKPHKPFETEAEIPPAPPAEMEKPVVEPPTAAPPTNDTDNKPVKVKSRWRKSSELEMNILTPAAVVAETCGDSEKIADVNTVPLEKEKAPVKDEEVEVRLKQFMHLKENLYLTDRMTCKEAKKMSCDCFLTSEEIGRGEFGCGDDCLNRLLMIECGNVCPVGDRCTNKKFQKSQFAPVEVFKTEKKGLGLRAAANIPYGEFILEYVGEVLDHDEFDARADDYSHDKNRHYYFMSLRADAIIDATMKGNISRFINHSCEPNAETQKWTVNGELRIGFFSTRTILAGEEITFDYRFQRYGKEAQKCYCEAPTCRGWLGEEPDDDDEEEEEEEEQEEEESEPVEPAKEVDVSKTDEVPEEQIPPEEVKASVEVEALPKKEKKKRAPRRKPRKDIFEDLDQLDEEIEMLITTGLKNQAHTLKLSRLMVRAKEPAQRTKLLRVLRRGELPCRRLFLDYHGLRLMHGYMTDAQHLAKTDQKFESLRLEMLQTLAVLPIPNKTMLQDSKVLPTVEKWASNKDELPTDSDSNSPQTDQDASQTPTQDENKKPNDTPFENIQEGNSQIKIEGAVKIENMDVDMTYQSVSLKEVVEGKVNVFQESAQVSPVISHAAKPIAKDSPEVKPEEPNYEEEIIALALKLLEEWSNLKEVFKIPKKERIEQMKEHEREANRGYIAGLGLEQDVEKKNESRYRISKRYRLIEKVDSSVGRKCIKMEDRNLSNFPKMGKYERRKMFALQEEQRKEEQRKKQREMWRQHEQHCMLLGTDPRFTAPFDPNRGYQCIYNPQINQWQNYPIQNPGLIFNPQNPTLPPMNIAPPPTPNFQYMQPPNLHMQPATMLPGQVTQIHPLPNLPYQEEVKKTEDYSQVKFMGPIPPPAKLPPKWKCAKDKYGRPYYYHIKIRKSQWEPPPLPKKPVEEPEESSDTTSSSETSSLSSETSSSESDTDDDVDDTKLLIGVKRQLKLSFPKAIPAHAVNEEVDTPSPVPVEGEKPDKDDKPETRTQDEEADEEQQTLSIDIRLKDKEDKLHQPPAKKRRGGLVHEIIISPRTEEDRLQFREDVKRYKANKEKLKREKELMVQQTKKHTKEKRHKSTVKAKMKEMSDANSENAKKIKEAFRSNMATVVVSVLNAYRKPECKEGRITNTEEFKHLARKLTHFVMLKEMKHIEKIEDLVCTENVKVKAKEYIRKYMSKFGEIYQKRNDEPDFN